MEVFMKIAVAGTGYVGLVSGVCLAHVGHDVTCVDIDEAKVKMMQQGISPIYEKDLEKLMIENSDKLTYTSNFKDAYKNADVIFIGVGTPEKEDGSANLDYVFRVADQIARSIISDKVVVIKSTVPIGTNEQIERYINEKTGKMIKVDVVSNPEFLAQGTAVKDTLYASRIVVGAENDYAKEIMKRLYEPFTKEPYNVPYLSTNRNSAEMIKYASNNFLALKISYINEMANLCELVGADIEEVAKGMGLDSRIGNKFLKAGIGYGGSCFPKDTKAIYQLAKTKGLELRTVKATIDINEEQKLRLIDKIKQDFGHDLRGIKIGVLGATFKPGTDDLREAPSIPNIEILLEMGAEITLYDPIAINKMKNIFEDQINYTETITDAIINHDIVMIMTEWPNIVVFELSKYLELMKTPYVYDGRNCYSKTDAQKQNIKYKSIGR
jgi:UDPglucose 6-dehydrogenase